MLIDAEDLADGTSNGCGLWVDFDPRVRLEFQDPKISSDGGLLRFRELNEVLGLHDLAGRFLRDMRRGKNGVHRLIGLLHQ